LINNLTLIQFSGSGIGYGSGYGSYGGGYGIDIKNYTFKSANSFLINIQAADMDRVTVLLMAEDTVIYDNRKKYI
jgi:hypothetical protein